MQVDSKTRETLHIWLAILIAIFVAGYRLFLAFIDYIREFLKPHTSLPITEWIDAVLFFWVLILLWVAYRKWRRSIQRQNELQTVLSSINPDTLLVTDGSERITMVNSAVEPMFGHAMNDVMNKSTGILYSEAHASALEGLPENPYEDFGFSLRYAEGKRKDGEDFPLEMIVADLRDGLGEVLLLRDITERKQAEKQIMDAKEHAEIASQEKGKALEDLKESYQKLTELEDHRDQLTHMIVHDLKSPLSAVTLKLDLILRSCQDSMLKEQAQDSLYLLDRLTMMISCLLDIGRLESNDMPLRIREQDLRAIAENAIAAMKIEAGKRKVYIGFEDKPIVVMGDASIIKRVLANLVGNAFKYTDPETGEIDILAISDDQGTTVKVRDNGEGIPAEHHDKIFDRFTQVEARGFSSGLGLNFCKLAIEAHGGSIGVISEIGKGSTFWFTLPTKPVAGHTP